jgi:two-component system NarL family sensor kinase
VEAHRQFVHDTEFSGGTSRPARDASRSVALFERVATVLATHTDSSRALDEILAVVADAFKIGAAWIWLIDPETARFYLAASRGLPPFLQEPVEMTGEPCWCLEALIDGDFETKNVRTIDCSRLRRAAVDGRPELAGGMKYHASVVLRFGDRQLGVLNLSRADWQSLSDDDLGVLSALGAQLGLALERARLALEANAAGRAHERARLAREIHDTLAQDLTGIGLHLEGSLRALERDPAVARERIETALGVARRSLDAARDAVIMLRSDPLGGSTLPVALARLTREFASEHGVLTALHTQSEFDVPYPVEAALFRVAGEALQNVRKHARARRVDVRLHAVDKWLELAIEDDGDGLSTAPRDGGHFGILGMTERMRALGGTLTVDPRDGRGTRVLARAPLEP